jgi:hypothetical protein
MPVALTEGMSVLKVAARNAALLFAAVAALCSVACSAGDDGPTYTGTDIESNAAGETGQPLRCETGSVQHCTIWLGQHGDLLNCAEGLSLCTDGNWGGCIDEIILEENPELYSELVGE